MGCVLCNIVYCSEFVRGKYPSVKNPFYCATSEEQEEFLQELAGDIASYHPELAAMIAAASGIKATKYHRSIGS